jgi:hypothetical protein
MTELVYYRLEYNEKTGMFETLLFSKGKENIYDWETIAMVIGQEEIDTFLSVVTKEFPKINSGATGSYPSAAIIKNMYNVFSGLSEF